MNSDLSVVIWFFIGAIFALMFLVTTLNYFKEKRKLTEVRLINMVLNRYQIQVYEQADSSKLIYMEIHEGFTPEEAIYEAWKSLPNRDKLIFPIKFHTTTSN